MDVLSLFRAGLLGSLFSLLQFFASPLIGASSDILGRKPVLVSTMVRACVYVLCMHMAYKEHSLHYRQLICDALLKAFNMHVPLQVKRHT